MPCAEVSDETEEALTMEWWLDAQMNKNQQRQEVSRLVGEGITKEFGAIHKKLDALSPAGQATTQGAPRHYWLNTILIALGSVIGSVILTIAITRNQEFATLKLNEIVDKKLDPLKKEISDIGKDVAKIKGADGISTNITPPALNAILQNVNQAIKSNPNGKQLKQIADQLVEVQSKYPSAPDVWRTTGEFITYKAGLLLPDAPAIQAKATGVPCREHIGFPGMVLQNCEVELESIDQNVTDNKVNGKPLPFIFINCLVHYRGGRLKTKGPIIFQKSVLRFEVSTVPPPSGVDAMKQLTIAMADNGQINLVL